MKNKFAFALAGLLAISSAAFAADGRDHGYRGNDNRGGYHENYRSGDRGYYRDYAYRGGHGYGGGGVYLGVGPSYYSDYAAPDAYVDPYAYAAPEPNVNPFAAPYTDQYVGPAPLGQVWVGDGWAYGPHGRYWARGHWGRR